MSEYCCERAKNSLLMQNYGYNNDKTYWRITSWEDIKPIDEKINFCPFCGKVLQ